MVEDATGLSARLLLHDPPRHPDTTPEFDKTSQRSVADVTASVVTKLHPVYVRSNATTWSAIRTILQHAVRLPSNDDDEGEGEDD